MDGNRRYAKNLGMDTIFGHRAGVKALERVIRLAPDYGIKTLTVYALSTENLVKRTQEEVQKIFSVMVEAIASYSKELIKHNVRAKFLGNIQSLPEDLRDSIQIMEEETAACSEHLLQICINYGGRDEIVRAVKKLVQTGQEITEESLGQALDSDLEPDLVIRTGGQQRVSNFLSWQAAYSELFFTETLWPEFDEKDLRQAMEFFARYERKFGQ